VQALRARLHNADLRAGLRNVRQVSCLRTRTRTHASRTPDHALGSPGRNIGMGTEQMLGTPPTRCWNARGKSPTPHHNSQRESMESISNRESFFRHFGTARNRIKRRALPRSDGIRGSSSVLNVVIESRSASRRRPQIGSSPSVQSRAARPIRAFASMFGAWDKRVRTSHRRFHAGHRTHVRRQRAADAVGSRMERGVL
jgi:hypothetical protein